MVNGPITYTIDGAPLVGPIPGIPNAFACLGLRAGIGEGGGHGKILAELMVHGECEWDAWYLDPRRFTQYANTEHTCLKAVEDYRNEFHYHLPHEHRPAARLARTTPLYPVLNAMHCEWGVVAGWERALFFKPDDDFVNQHSFRFTPTMDIVAREVKGIVEGVGIMEVSGFNRYEIKGHGAGDFLDTMICGAMPKTTGQIRLCYLLTEKGNVLGEATITRLGQGHASCCNRFRLGLTGQNRLFRGCGQNRCLSATAQVLAMSVSFSGELSYELHVPNEQLYLVWKILDQAGKDFNLVYFGLYATESMRVEKGYLHWKADLIYEHNPMETGLDRFVRLDKPYFVGKKSLLMQRQWMHRWGSKKPFPRWRPDLQARIWCMSLQA